MRARFQRLVPRALRRGNINPLRVLLACIDAVIFSGALLFAIWLRFDGSVPADMLHLYLRSFPWITPLLVAVCLRFGLYNRIWEYASLDAARAILASVTLGVVLATVVLGFEGQPFPHGVIAIWWGFSLMAVTGSRFGWRMLRLSLFSREIPREGQRRVLIYGAGLEGAALAKQADADPQSPYHVAGFIDDAPQLRGMVVAGHRILGSGDQLETILARHPVDELIVALPRVSGEKLEQVMQAAAEASVTVRTVPRLLELVAGRSLLPQVRDIHVADLLGRAPTCPDLGLAADYVAGRCVMVTGAGGSIGSEICRQLCRYHPARIVLLGRGENRIHKLYYELLDTFPDIRFEPVICNITSLTSLGAVLRKFGPQTIFHAAAHKHVFLMECNPLEAALNNVLGTATLANLAEALGVERFVQVSTDKAVEPTSVMGATKALCEQIVAHKHANGNGTRFMTVRFGNVLGSTGSVVPIFQQLAAAGRPLPVTDPEATRYFMTIEEAAFLVLQAAALGGGGDVFVLEMGRPIRILDVARTILKLHGHDPDASGAVEFIGLRPGEKLHEELVGPCERLAPTSCPGIVRVVLNGRALPPTDLEWTLNEMRGALADGSASRVLEVLASATGAQFSEATQSLCARQAGRVPVTVGVE